MHERTNQKKLSFTPKKAMKTADNEIAEVGEPSEMSKFYSKSRLHHISSWRNYFVDEARKFMEDKISKRPVDYKEPEDRIIMLIDMDCFFASVSIRDQPHFENLPVVISSANETSDLSKSNSELSTCNYAARKFGIRKGM